MADNSGFWTGGLWAATRTSGLTGPPESDMLDLKYYTAWIIGESDPVRERLG